MVQGKVIVITGAFGILGAAAVEAARLAGATPVAIDHAHGSGDLAFGGVDLREEAQAQAAMSEIRARTGRIDALLNIAGGFEWSELAGSDAALWRRMFERNVLTAVNASRAALPHLQETEGAIVNVAANAALKAGAGMGAYAASKAGVLKLTESLAEEMKGRVRVNAVLPSILDTPQNRKDMPEADPSRWVQPAALARIMLFLVGNDARPITGALIPVTGQA